MKKLILAVFLSSIMPLHAQWPPYLAESSQYFDQIPLYPNARFLEAGSKELRDMASFHVKDHREGMSILAYVFKAFTVDATWDEVENFYKKKLNSVQVSRDYQYPKFADLKANSSTSVFFGVGTLGDAFTWYTKASNGDVLDYEVVVTDGRNTNLEGAGRTVLMLSLMHYSRTAPTYVPTEDVLGAPLYGNSKYVPEESTVGGHRGSHMFVSEDALGAIVAFFEKALRVKVNSGLGLQPGDTNVALRDYSTKHPMNFVSIEQHQFQGKPRVVILYFCSPGEPR